jgi:hypothetical protein
LTNKVEKINEWQRERGNLSGMGYVEVVSYFGSLSNLDVKVLQNKTKQNKTKQNKTKQNKKT